MARARCSPPTATCCRRGPERRGFAFRRSPRAVRTRQGFFSGRRLAVRVDVVTFGRAAAVGVLAVLAACLDLVDPGDATVASVAVVFDGSNTKDTINVRGTTRARAIAVAEEGYDL